MEANDTGVPAFVGVAKYDLQAGAAPALVATALHGPRRRGGEAFFVPRKGATEEDDGYLLTYVTDEQSLQSELVVYDAASMASRPLARLRMPQRVPSGFHGTWVTAEQLAAQLA
jgi:carotenoid cleavage dioxygenase